VLRFSDGKQDTTDYRFYADVLVMPMFGVLPQVRPPGWFLRSA